MSDYLPPGVTDKMMDEYMGRTEHHPECPMSEETGVLCKCDDLAEQERVIALEAKYDRDQDR